MPPLLDYQNLGPPGPKTRATASDSCNCQVCLIARQNLDYAAYAASQSNPVGAPPVNPKSPPQKTLAVCSKCWGAVGKGIPHDCQKSSKVENITNIVKSTSEKSRSKVTSSSLKVIAEEQEVSTRGGVLNLKTGGNPLPVQIGAPTVKPREPKFSHENMKKLQAATNLSDKMLL